MVQSFARVTGVAAIVTILGMGCSSTMSHQMTPTTMAAAPRSAGTTSVATPAAELRTGINALLSEHVILAAAATGAALEGRSGEFQAAAGALDANSVDIAKAIGAVYGSDTEQAFLPLWRRHIGFAVDYTQGIIIQDKAEQDKAVADLVQYTQDFGAFWNAADPSLPKDVVADLVKTHVLTLKNVIDAQAAKDPVKSYAALRTAAHHMHMIADPLAGTMAKQFPAKFTGSTESSAADLRAMLNVALREHVYLAAAATGAVLGGRNAEFQAAAGALDANSVDIAKAIGSVYGPEAENAFLPLWRRHIGFVVDYTQGVASKDRAKQDKAVADLVQYTQDFGALLNAANPNLPKKVVADLVKTHVLTLREVIDAQASRNLVQTYTALRNAAGHMAMIANPLSDAIVMQFPARYSI